MKVAKSKEKWDAIKGPSARKKKAEEKCKEVFSHFILLSFDHVEMTRVFQRQKQYKIQKHLLLKNRNDYLLGISRCNALSTQYFNIDIMDIIEVFTD